jgi:hypothetical protein
MRKKAVWFSLPDRDGGSQYSRGGPDAHPQPSALVTSDGRQPAHVSTRGTTRSPRPSEGGKARRVDALPAPHRVIPPLTRGAQETWAPRGSGTGRMASARSGPGRQAAQLFASLPFSRRAAVWLVVGHSAAREVNESLTNRRRQATGSPKPRSAGLNRTDRMASNAGRFIVWLVGNGNPTRRVMALACQHACFAIYKKKSS